MNRFVTFGIAIGVAALLPGTAHAASDASGSMRIRVVVPRVCNIDASTFAVDTLLNQATGTVQEFCNSSDGFMIMASHRPLEAGEQIQMNYDGEVSNLSASGLSPVIFRAGPRLRTVPVSIQSVGLQSAVAVSLGLTPI